MLGKSLFLPALNKMEVSFCLRHCQSSQGKSIFLRSVHYTVNLHVRLMMQSEMHSYVWVNIHKTSDFLKDSTLIFLFSFTTYQNLWLTEVAVTKEAQKGWADVAQRNVGETEGCQLAPAQAMARGLPGGDHREAARSAELFVVITAILEMSPTLKLVWMSRLMMPHLYQENRRKVYSHKEIFWTTGLTAKLVWEGLRELGKENGLVFTMVRVCG